MKKENLKSNFPTSNTAISLIALIITLIVLLILATVTFSFILGDNGIIKKASLAKEKTNIAQDKETEELEVLENTINEMSLSRKSSNSSTVLYPGGTQDNPGTIRPYQRVEIDNPYPGHTVYCIAQILTDTGYWGETGYMFYSGGGYGLSAKQLEGNNYDKIIIQSGRNSLIAGQGDADHPFSDSILKLSSADIPYRVKVICLD